MSSKILLSGEERAQKSNKNVFADYAVRSCRLTRSCCQQDLKTPRSAFGVWLPKPFTQKTQKSILPGLTCPAICWKTFMKSKSKQHLWVIFNDGKNVLTSNGKDKWSEKFTWSTHLCLFCRSFNWESYSRVQTTNNSFTVLSPDSSNEISNQGLVCQKMHVGKSWIRFFELMFEQFSLFLRFLCAGLMRTKRLWYWEGTEDLCTAPRSCQTPDTSCRAQKIAQVRTIFLFSLPPWRHWTWRTETKVSHHCFFSFQWDFGTWKLARTKWSIADTIIQCGTSMRGNCLSYLFVWVRIKCSVLKVFLWQLWKSDNFCHETCFFSLSVLQATILSAARRTEVPSCGRQTESTPYAASWDTCRMSMWVEQSEYHSLSQKRVLTEKVSSTKRGTNWFSFDAVGSSVM